MDNFRRRIVGIIDSYVFKLSNSTDTTISVDATDTRKSVYITSTLNGNICSYSIVSYTPSFITGVVQYNNGTDLSINFSKNDSGSTRSGTIVLKQDGSNNTLTLTVLQFAYSYEYEHEAIILDKSSGSTGSTVLYTYFLERTRVTENCTINNVPSWITATFSNGMLNVTATSTNDSTTARVQSILVTVLGITKYITIILMPTSFNSIDGYEYVTMNGLKWAIKNVGASSITDTGNYYKYGTGSKLFDGQNTIEYSGTEDPLDYSVDTARQVMGGGWRTPTAADVIHFNAGYWTSYNGVSGFSDYSGDRQNVIFIPASGYMSSNGLESTDRPYIMLSTPTNSTTSCSMWWRRWYASHGDIESNGASLDRTCGLPVRGVHD